MSKFKTVIETLQNLKPLTEMVHYPSDNMVFQKDSKFIDVSVANINRMIVIKQTDDFLFVKSGAIGYVFAIQDIVEAGDGEVKPALHVHLRDSFKGFQQAHNLRIREKYSGNNLAKQWYYAYVNGIEPIVSDKDHLEGGYRLWKAFIKFVTKNTNYSIKMIDTNTNEIVRDNITTEVPDEEIWSRHTKDNKDQSKSNLVLVFGKTEQL